MYDVGSNHLLSKQTNSVNEIYFIIVLCMQCCGIIRYLEQAAKVIKKLKIKQFLGGKMSIFWESKGLGVISALQSACMFERNIHMINGHVTHFRPPWSLLCSSALLKRDLLLCQIWNITQTCLWGRKRKSGGSLRNDCKWLFKTWKGYCANNNKTILL